MAGLKGLFNGELVGYSMSKCMSQSLIMKALFGLHLPRCARQRCCFFIQIEATITNDLTSLLGDGLVRWLVVFISIVPVITRSYSASSVWRLR